MRALLQLAPLAVGLLIFVAVATFTLQRHMAVGAWLVAAFLVGHGLVHVMFAAPPPATAATPGAEFAFDANRSWLVTSGVLNVSVVRAVVVALVAVTVIGYVLAGAATIGLVVPGAWWSFLLMGATATSGLLMLIGLSPGLALGIAIDVVLVWLVAARVWTPVPAG